MNRPLHIRSLRALVWRYPLKTPVVTSFGSMRDRPMVLVRAEDTDGNAGWGEIWCNFPAVGAEHRARLVHGVLAPILTSRPFENAAAAFDALTEQTAVLALQAGEPGPFAQAIAGVDIALWDLQARRAQQPLWRFLGGASPRVKVYASGLNPDRPADVASTRRNEGFRAFKLKIGFGKERDVANVGALRASLGDGVDLMVDANQAWSVETAIDMARALEPFYIAWLEEPLRVDRPWSEWQSLREHTRSRLRPAKTSRVTRDSMRRLRRTSWRWSSRTSRNGAVLHAACRSRAASLQRVRASVRTGSGAVSAFWRRRTRSRRWGAAACSKSTPIPIRCAPQRAVRWPR